MNRRKNAEIEYPNKLDEEGQKWLWTKPYSKKYLDESRRTIHDIATIMYLIEKHKPDADNIMELGCGPGWLAITLAKLGYQVSGYDISPTMIKIAKQRARKEVTTARFDVLDIEGKLQADQNRQNDIVVIYDALHHIRSEEKVLSYAFKYLKPAGILILGEPNRIHNLGRRAQKAEADFGVTERGLSYGKLAKICRQFGFRKIYRYHASGQSFLPRNESLTETWKMIFYPLLARFIFGKFKTRIWLVAEK